MQLSLPKLEKVIWKQSGNKNKIIQLLAREAEVDLPVVDIGRSYLIIGNDEIQYYLTCNENNIPGGYSHVIMADKRPTEQRLEDNEIKFKQWLRHPALANHSVEAVRTSWHQDFHFQEEDLQNNQPGLRLPQIGAVHAILSHLKVGDETGTVVMPTGTGKTEAMLSVLVANKCERLLVAVPTDALRQQIFQKFVTLGLLKDFSIIGDQSLYPRVGLLKTKFADIQELEDFFNQCNVIVTTMQLVADSPLEHQRRMSSLSSHLFIDEAHHAKANSWHRFASHFQDSQVIQFTATPFRNDQKRLDGKIIFDFPLKKAQEQGYFKKINFLPVREYDSQKADALIAEVAVNKLREDRAAGYDHILMARCANKKKAQDIFHLYAGHADLNPVCIYSGITGKAEILGNIVAQKHQIIVCVDMLGEGFDLPELKIAAMHDVRKSLPVTLQYSGRFTRTKHDKVLGEATFIANLADLDVAEALEQLYAQNADWNLILRTLGDSEVAEVIDYEELLAGFSNLDKAVIPFQNISPALSAVVYKNHSPGWQPQNFRQGIRKYDDYAIKFHDINEDKKLLVIVTAQKAEIDWGKFNDVYQLVWNVIIVHWDTDNNLLFIHGSDKKPLYQELAKAIIGGNAEIINEVDAFKAFAGINRVTLKNVGLKEFLGKNIRFRMSVGADVEKALSMAEMQKGQKAFVVGTGYENGNKVSLGCSYKGRIWSLQSGDLNQLTAWCHKIGKKLIDEEIDANQILRETLIPALITTRPGNFPVWVDWPDEIYRYPEAKYIFRVNGHFYDLANCELHIVEPSNDGDILFELVTGDEVIIFEKRLFERAVEGGTIPEFEIINRSDQEVVVIYGNKEMAVHEFFHEYPPAIWFADGAALTGNSYVELKNTIAPYPRDNIIAWGWDGVNLGNESQHVDPRIEDSIQYNVIQRLQGDDVDIIYDDDYAGEVADVITIKQHKDKLKVCFYHLKYAKGGKISNRIDNFYEVCGQAQKSIHWKHRDGNEFIRHLLHREVKKRNGAECSRLEKGSIDDLERLFKIAKKKIPIEWEIYIVQPGASKITMSDDILTLLGVTENYLMEIAGIKLGVICSE